MNAIQKLLDLRQTSDPQKAIETIIEGVSIKGYNMWLLFCSAALASIGLDTSSAAVVIGAMLISPLMSPILGIGLSIGIHDRELMFQSFRNFFAAVVLSLTASVLYFLISPFAYPTPEIVARTYPTLLDVLVALFGGIAGIISISRAGISNAIPGVAIATALMPPLCTAGYGLATAQWRYFGGAFYLFFINAVFISLATYLIVKYLKFPVQSFATRKQKNYYAHIFFVIVIVVTVPSAYFLYTVYQTQMVNRKLATVVLIPIKQKGNEILKWELENKDSIYWVKVYHSGSPLPDSFKSEIAKNLAVSNMKQYILKPFRINMTKEEVNELSADVSRQMFQQLQLDELAKLKYAPAIETLSYEQVFKETKIAFPYLDTLYNGWMTLPDTTGKIDTLPVVLYKSGVIIKKQQQQQLNDFLKVRFKMDTVVIIRQ